MAAMGKGNYLISYISLCLEKFEIIVELLNDNEWYPNVHAA